MLEWQPDGERDSAAFVVDDVDPPAMRADDAPHDEQAEAGAARLCREIRLENLAHVFRRDAAAGVAERHRRMVVIDVGFDVQNPPAAHRLKTVFDHVVKRLLELVPVDFKQRQFGAQLGLDDDVAVLDLGL